MFELFNLFPDCNASLKNAAVNVNRRFLVVEIHGEAFIRSHEAVSVVIPYAHFGKVYYLIRFVQ